MDQIKSIAPRPSLARLLCGARLLCVALFATVALFAGANGVIRAQTRTGTGAGRRAAGRTGGEPATGVVITWEVMNRFRLFRDDRDFRRHVDAPRAGAACSMPSRIWRKRPRAAAGRATWWCACASTPSARWRTSACATACGRITSPPRTTASKSGSRARCRPGRPAPGPSATATASRAPSMPIAANRSRSGRATAGRPWPPSTSRSPASRSAAPPARSPCAIS